MSKDYDPFSVPIETGPVYGPLLSQYHCLRCGWFCQHVEAMGIWSCPNCGPSHEAAGGVGVTYDFNCGCRECNREGHPPLPGFMQPVPRNHPRFIFGLAPKLSGPQVSAANPNKEQP